MQFDYKKLIRRIVATILVSIILVAGMMYLWNDEIISYGIYGIIQRFPQRPIGSITFPKKLEHVAYEHFEVITPDSCHLRGWLLRPDQPSHSTIIFLHGIHSSRLHTLPFGVALRNQGFNVVVLDMRSHGESDGQFITYGFYEKYDISSVIDEILRRDSSQKIGISGFSLGGAIALQAMAYDSRIVCGHIESTFASLREIVREYAEHDIHVAPLFLTNYILDKAGVIAKFSPDSVQPVQSAQRIVRPIRIVHGSADTKITQSHGERIYRAVSSEQKSWVSVQGANHDNLREIAGKSYQDSTIAFFRKYLK